MKNLNKPFLKIRNLAYKIIDLSYEATMKNSEKEKEKCMNKIIDAAEAMEEIYTCDWH